MKSLFLWLFLLSSCATQVGDAPSTKAPSEFSSGEVILAWEFLNKIFDQEVAPIACVEDKDEAALLLRTLNPRMEVVQDDIEAVLDDSNQITKLVQDCRQNCTCHYLEDLFKEHQVNLTKSQTQMLELHKKQKDRNNCLRFIQETFCQSDLYRALEQEKKDFSFEE